MIENSLENFVRNGHFCIRLQMILFVNHTILIIKYWLSVVYEKAQKYREIETNMHSRSENRRHEGGKLSLYSTINHRQISLSAGESTRLASRLSLPIFEFVKRDASLDDMPCHLCLSFYGQFPLFVVP